jgi:hypothetical protein
MTLTLKLRDAGLLAGAMALLGTHFGCGRVANVLESPESGKGATKGTSGGNNVFEADGSVAGFGAGGVPPLIADGGTPPPFAQGGAPYGVGGKAGAPSSGGFAGGQSPPSSLDPHAAQRHELAMQLCALPETNKCLQLVTANPFTTTPQSDCQNMVEINAVENAGNDCWNEWVANAQCELGRKDFCPCSGNDCNYYAAPDFSPDCAASYATLDACTHKNVGYGTVTGKLGTVWWHVDQNGCVATWYTDYHDITMPECTGVGDSIQQCKCTATGVFLGDQAQFIHNDGAYDFWYGSNCGDVAQQFADGKCSDILNCCFTWTSHDNPDAGPNEQCGCTADPKQAGYDSCDAIAAAGNGKVVDVCPRYVPNPGSFPGKPPQQ